MGVVRINNVNQMIRKNEQKKTKQNKVWQVRMKDVRRLKRWERFDLNNAKQVWDNFEDVGRFMLNMEKRLGPFDSVVNAWENKPAFVVGSSISARGFDLNKLDGLNTIGVNHMIDCYHKFKWFLFQDQRFLRIAKYDLKKYKGKIFAHNNTPIMKSEYKDVCFIKTQHQKDNQQISLDPNKGVFPRVLTGAAALHVALISGANPIYMIGCDTPEVIDMTQGHHYSIDYTGEVNNKKSYDGTTGKYVLYKAFLPWADRIINVCENGRIDFFKKISFQELDEILEELKK
jgi:hypothetical protein